MSQDAYLLAAVTVLFLGPCIVTAIVEIVRILAGAGQKKEDNEKD